jgi:hypothetical protein
MRLYNGVWLALFAGTTAVIISALSGCDYQSEKTSTEAAMVQVNRPVGYDEVNTKVFKKYCVDCHTSRGPVLTDYTTTKAGGDLIRQAVLVDKRMPKTGPLPPDLQGLLKAWLDQSMPLNAGDEPDKGSGAGSGSGSEPGQDPDPGVVKWSAVKAQVFSKCTQCHFAGNDQGRMSFSDAQSARDNVDDILTMAVEGQMPPEGQTPLTKAEKLTLTRWVIDGMQD